MSSKAMVLEHLKRKLGCRKAAVCYWRLELTTLRTNLAEEKRQHVKNMYLANIQNVTDKHLKQAEQRVVEMRKVIKDLKKEWDETS